jgi:hypothetical protein
MARAPRKNANKTVRGTVQGAAAIAAAPTQIETQTSPAAAILSDGATGEAPAGESGPFFPAGVFQEVVSPVTEAVSHVTGDGTELVFAPAQGAMLEVTGPKKGRRRAGRTFGRTPVRIPLADLSEAEIAAIMADPTLSTVTVDGVD